MRNTQQREIELYRTQNGREPFTEWFESIRDKTIINRIEMRKLRKWRDYLIERLAADKDEALGYLDVALEEYQEDGDTLFFLQGIRDVVEAQGGITELAKRTHMSPDALQKTLSSDKAPHIDTLGTILNALGCRLSIVPVEAEKPCSEIATEN
jgi:DNA-binding phage protein